VGGSHARHQPRKCKEPHHVRPARHVPHPGQRPPRPSAHAPSGVV
jgi:hypothetical protein